MTLLVSILALWLGGVAAAERPALVVQAPAPLVQIDRATVVAIAGAPPILLYAATNITDDDLEQFTVIAFVFDSLGTLKAKQTAPARRFLPARETKHSTLVLDGSLMETTDVIVVGVNQVQRTETSAWWRADLEALARAAVERRQR